MRRLIAFVLWGIACGIIGMAHGEHIVRTNTRVMVYRLNSTHGPFFGQCATVPQDNTEFCAVDEPWHYALDGSN
jgi:hypothetical protein